MDDVVFVHVGHPLTDLPHVVDTVLLCKVMRRLRQPLVQVTARQAEIGEGEDMDYNIHVLVDTVLLCKVMRRLRQPLVQVTTRQAEIGEEGEDMDYNIHVLRGRTWII